MKHILIIITIIFCTLYYGCNLESKNNNPLTNNQEINCSITIYVPTVYTITTIEDVISFYTNDSQYVFITSTDSLYLPIKLINGPLSGNLNK